MQAVAKLRELGTATAGQLYNAARVFSLSAAAIKLAEGEELTAEQTRQRDQYIQDALATLRQAIAAGWKDFAHVRKDPDLAPLRDREEFKKIVTELAQQAPPEKKSKP